MYKIHLFPLLTPQLILQEQIILLPQQKKVTVKNANLDKQVLIILQLHHSTSILQPINRSFQNVSFYLQLAILTTQDEFDKKLQEMEKKQKQEIKELEQKMQYQIEAISAKKSQEDQQRQFQEVKQQMYELQSSLSGNTFYAGQHNNQFNQNYNDSERLEKQLKKKKNKIKNQKVLIESLRTELQTRQQRVNELEIKLHFAEKQPVIHQPPSIIHKQEPSIPFIHPSVIHQQPQIIYDSPELIERIRNLEIERDELNHVLRFQQGQQIQAHKLAPSQQQQHSPSVSVDEWNRLMHEYKVLEAENNKLNTIILQKDDLIRSLEQRISVELTKQSALFAQGNPARPISVYYEPQSPSQQIQQQQAQPILDSQSNVQPTLQTSTQ